ncbi:MAG TPA: hypothetical protein DCY62_10375, partial [Thalassospira sp.]|nr:hypothetical protein [Thalassospira sp.]
MAVSAQLSKIRNPNTPTWTTSSRKDMWLGLLERLNSDNRAFQTFLEEYATGADITLSRRDVRSIFALDASKGVIGT